MVVEDDSEKRASQADLRRERYIAHLTRYCFEVHEAERDTVAWPALARAVKADEADPSKLPLPFVLQLVVAPKFWAAGALSNNSPNEAIKLAEEYAKMWRVYFKPKRKPRPRKRRKLLTLIVAALCFSEGLATHGRRNTEGVMRVAVRIGMTRRQVLYSYDQVCARRKDGADEVFNLATDTALERIASLMWAIDEREDRSERDHAYAARHYKPDLEGFAAASAASSKLKGM